MSLFRQPLRPGSSKSEQAVARYVASIRAHLEPDPLFERRLRGRVVNQFVASRQSSGSSAGRRQMGMLGRAVLYASVTLAVTVGGALAASQDALPGDVLYPLKRQVERLRVEVLPVHLHDDLVAIELTERLDELDRLTRADRSVDAGALMSEIRDDYALLVDVEPDAASVVGSHLVALKALVDRLPDGARAAVQDVLARVDDTRGRPADSGSVRDPASPSGSPNGRGTGTGTGNGSENGNAGGQSDGSNGQGGGAPADPGSASDRTQPPEPSPKPTKSPKAAD